MPIVKGALKKKGYYVVIFGCGRLGSRIANWLSSTGNSVVVVDKDERAFDALSYEFTGFKIVGNANELETLKLAKVNKADFVLSLTPDDNTNIMVALVSKEIFGIPQVIARVYDPNNLDMFSQFGIEIICPTLLAVDSVKSALSFMGGEEK